MMNADRTVLTDAMWARVGPMLPVRATDPGATAADSRRFVEAHRKAAGAPEGGGRGRGTCRQGIGCSRGGLTGKAVAAVDALRHPVRFVILPGQAHGPAGTAKLLDGLPFGALVGDRASGADWLLEDLALRGAEAVIPSKRNRTEPREHDREMHGWRHRVGNFLARTREFRAIATRCDRTDAGFAAGIHPVAGVVAAA